MCKFVKSLSGFIFFLTLFSIFFSTPTQASCPLVNTLRQGDKGTEVTCLQTKLNITTDGKFGKNTKQNVISFQKSNNLKQDGIVGPLTRDMLSKKDIVAIAKVQTETELQNQNMTEPVISDFVSTSQVPLPIQATPTFNPSAGARVFGRVTIYSEGADNIYYTTDGTDPTTSSFNQAKTPLSILNQAITIKAIATRVGYQNSAVGSVTYIYRSKNRVVPLSVGDAYQGGIVAYILQAGDPGYDVNVQHGIIAAPADLSEGLVAWGCSGTTISGADGTALGTGHQNTLDVIAGCATSGIAARLARDYTGGEYTDWYLPSKDELNKLYLNRVDIGGFVADGYWSSSEYSSTQAWVHFFDDGSSIRVNKNNIDYVRAVRSF